MDLLTRESLDELLSTGALGRTSFDVCPESGLSICGSDSDDVDEIEFQGVKYRPDKTKGYVLFVLSHAFPVVNMYGQAIHPGVVSRSYGSMLHQPFNWEHKMHAYNPDNQTDKILGSILAVEFPRAPMGGWKLAPREKSPGIRAVASFAKLARGMDQVVGKHKTGRHTYSVSMEVTYPYRECAFAVALNGSKPKSKTPDDMAEAGWEYVQWVDAEPALLECFSVKKNRIVSQFKGRDVVQMLGGIDGSVDYSGVGMVFAGAEKEAAILRLAASSTDDVILKALQPLVDFLAKIDAAVK